MGKAKQVKATPTEQQPHTYQCVVCGNDLVLYPYARLSQNERKTKRDCVCCSTCNEKYLKGEYNHG